MEPCINPSKGIFLRDLGRARTRLYNSLLRLLYWTDLGSRIFQQLLFLPGGPARASAANTQSTLFSLRVQPLYCQV